MSSPLTANELSFADHVASALRIYQGRTNATMKMLARDVGVAEATAKGWINAYFPPGGENMIELARVVPEVRELVMRMIGHVPAERERKFAAAARDILALLESKS